MIIQLFTIVNIFIWKQDMGACVENILLEAAYLEVGAVWLGIATAEEYMNYINTLFYFYTNINDNFIP